jgi:hypothetical protein
MKLTWFLLPLFLVPQSDPSEKQKRVQQLMAWFADKDASVSQSARDSLVAIGKEALPAIDRKLADLGALPLADLRRDIDRNLPSVSEPYALPADESVEVKADKEVSDKYVRAKYAEALAWAKRENFQKGFDITNALHSLEPRSSIAEKVNQLRRVCENKITQTTLIEAKIFPEKPATKIGELATVTLRLKNVFRNPIVFKYEGAEGKAPEGLVVIELEAGISTLRGESASRNKHQEFFFEGEISLAPGAAWERRLQLDTAFELPDDVDIQTITVNAWTQPSKIDAEGVNLLRRLQFEPATVKLVPKRYAHLIEKPLEWLSKTIETDRPAQETWICVQLLPDDEKRKGAEVLVQAMSKTENPDYRPALARMLTYLTGEKLGSDPKKWSEWLSKPAEKKKK